MRGTMAHKILMGLPQTEQIKTSAKKRVSKAQPM
jgi:hypothetical protein